MNKRIRRLFPFAFYNVALLFVFSACSPLIVPTPYHVPAVQDKGDLHLNVLTGMSAFNAQGAYMASDRIFISSTYSTNLEKHETNGHVHHQTSIGAGYIYKHRKTQWAIAGGYKWGKSRDNSTTTDGQVTNYNSTQIDYRSIYLQPYFNVLISRGFNLYGGLRTSLITTSNFYTNEEYYRINPGNTGTIEPFVGLRAGYKKLMFEIQYGIYSHADTYQNMFLKGDDVLNTHIGIGYTFGFSKKNAKK